MKDFYCWRVMRAVLLAGLCFCSLPVTAQRLPKKALQGLTKSVRQAEKTAQTAAARVRGLAAARAAERAGAAQPYNMQTIRAHIKSAVFIMQNSYTQASGFFLEEYYFGKRLVWAVIPAHAVEDEYPFFMVQYQGLDGKIYQRDLRVWGYGSGGYQNYDFALSLIPEDMEKEVFALRLAQQPPQKGDKVCSFGFYDMPSSINKKSFVPQENAGREILSLDNSRLTTSYPFGNRTPAGACGGPLLNEQGEVVGIHSGSNRQGSCSFAVESSGPVRELLADIHGDKQLVRRMLWNGKEVARLYSYQRVSRVEVIHNGQLISRVLLTKREAPFDYAALEKLFPSVHPGDKVKLLIKDSHHTEETVVEFIIK